MKICYISTQWASNIGNAFYDLGLIELIKDLNDVDLYLSADVPGNLSDNIKNQFPLISKLDSDIYIISGPAFNFQIEKLYKNIFESISNKGGKIAFISVGASKYSKEETHFVSEFLNKYSLACVSTRDNKTYELYNNKLNCEVYDGVCTSMFIPNNIVPTVIDFEYYVYNFRPRYEPNITIAKEGVIEIKKTLLKRRSNYLNGKRVIRTATVSFPTKIPKLSSFSLFDPFYYLYRKYDYHSDLPYGYLSIYRSADTVFSDRVHTCASTLALGGKAMFIKTHKYSMDNRSSLFSRWGVNDIFIKPVYLSIEKKEEERILLIKFLSQFLN